MTPHNEPGHDPARRPLCRVRTSRRRPRTLPAGARRQTTLWPFAEAEPLPGTALLAGWFGHTILTLVTTYTRPGDRVLLLAPPAPVLAAPRARVSPYAGLFEAVWTIARLGRGVDTATTDPPQHVGAESASRPRPDHPSRPPASGRPIESVHRPRGRFDLIITTVDPRNDDSLNNTDWDALATPRGLVAVVTHGDFQRGRLVDPATQTTTTMRNHGLRCLDHIAVLNAPLPDPIDSQQRQFTGDLPPVRQVHYDLLLFARITTPNQREHPDA